MSYIYKPISNNNSRTFSWCRTFENRRFIRPIAPRAFYGGIQTIYSNYNACVGFRNEQAKVIIVGFLSIPDRCVIDLWLYGLAFSHRSRSPGHHISGTDGKVRRPARSALCEPHFRWAVRISSLCVRAIDLARVVVNCAGRRRRNSQLHVSQRNIFAI